MTTRQADAIAGAFSGVASVFAGHPLDTVKVRLQSRAPSDPRGLLPMAMHIVATDGFRGLYAGVVPPLVGGAGESAINFCSFTSILERIGRRAPSGERSPLPTACAAAGAGGALAPFLSPFELVKCRVQAHVASSSGECLKSLLKEEGILGLSRGLTGALAREIPGNASMYSPISSLSFVVEGSLLNVWTLMFLAVAFVSYDFLLHLSRLSASKMGMGMESSNLFAGLSTVLCGGLAGVQFPFEIQLLLWVQRFSSSFVSVLRDASCRMGILAVCASFRRRENQSAAGAEEYPG